MAITYRGITLPYGKHSDSTTPRASKIISFPAVNGTEEMDMGKRQREFSIEGLVTDLEGGFSKDTLENWIDGSVGTLDIHGIYTHTNVKLVSVSFRQAYKNAVTGTITCAFTANFRKLQ